MYHMSTQGIDESMINVHYYYTQILKSYIYSDVLQACHMELRIQSDGLGFSTEAPKCLQPLYLTMQHFIINIHT